MFIKTKTFQLCFALALGIIVLLLPRPEGTKFKITGDDRPVIISECKQLLHLSVC